MENIDEIIDDEINNQDDTNEEQSIQDHKHDEEYGVVETKCPPKTIEKAKKPKSKAQQEAWARCLAGRREAVERRKKEKAKLNEKIKKIKKEPIVLSEDEEQVSSSSEDEPEPVVIVKKKRKKIEKKKKPKVQYVYESEDEDTDNTDDEDYEPSPPPLRRSKSKKNVEPESEDDTTPQQNDYENLDWRSRARLRGF